MRPGDTPVLIPNTTVKTRAADGTMLETAWESRRAPDFWGYSSAGRAPALQAGGQGFESPYLHGGKDQSAAANLCEGAGRKDCFPNRACEQIWEGIRRMPVMKQALPANPAKARDDKSRESEDQRIPRRLS